MTILEGLNPQQRQAVEHDTGPLLVVAGAGTGKTQVITRRIAHLIQEERAKPEEILALTFTEKAAQEMADRLFGLIGWSSFTVPVMTFNAFGAQLLSKYGSHIGRSSRGGLINDTQKTLLLKQRLSKVKLRYYGLQGDIFALLETVVGYIGRLQNAGVTAADYRTFVDGLAQDAGGRSSGDVHEQQDLADLYELYEKIKHDTGTFDYYDQLAVPLEILRSRPNLRDRLRASYKYVLVDEYQDTSPVQDALLRELVPPGGNIFAVGDDDQAIYGFRGADIENILQFTAHFQVDSPLALVQNYRSGQPILDAAYRLIRHNDPERLETRLSLDKRLIGQTDEASVAYVPYRTAADEQAAVVAAIETALTTGGQTSDIAILARSNAVLRSYAKALRGQQIPFAISTSVNIFEQRELINLWYVLEWIGQRAKDEAISHIILGPFIGWRAAQLRQVVDRSRTDLCTLEVALRALADDGDAASAELVARLDMWREWAATDPVSQLAYRLVFEHGLAERLAARGADEPRVVRVFEDLHRLLEQMQDYESVELDQTLAGYLATYPKPPELEVSETLGDPDGIQLLTVHASKGLEFETVYVVNCTARSWSAQSGGGSLEVPVELTKPSDLPAEHEQRRLMYVAATRAKKYLWLSSPVATAGGTKQAPSPLLTELLEGELPALEAVPRETNVEKSLKKLQRFYPLQQELPDRLPFERLDGWIELAVGDLERYKDSPHDFFLQKVLGISQPFGPQLAFGSAIHGAIQLFFEAQLRGEQATVEEMTGRLNELWSDLGYESAALAETAKTRAYDTLSRFHAREVADPSIIKATELPIQLEIPEAKLRLRGRIDATIETDEGLEVRDFKTGQVSDPEKLLKKAKDSFQLRTYALAIQELSGAAPRFVTLDYVVTGTVGQAVLTPAILRNHREKLIELAAKLRARDFAPGTPSAFNNAAAFRYYGTESEEGESNE